jgi:hypothetical protein
MLVLVVLFVRMVFLDQAAGMVRVLRVGGRMTLYVLTLRIYVYIRI